MNPQEKIQNSTKFNGIGLYMAYCLKGKEKIEQERTRIKKELFLKYWAVTRGIISVTCDKVDIDRGTFYNWERDDEELGKH